jgi:hypothetical protein
MVTVDFLWFLVGVFVIVDGYLVITNDGRMMVENTEACHHKNKEN